MVSDHRSLVEIFFTHVEMQSPRSAGASGLNFTKKSKVTARTEFHHPCCQSPELVAVQPAEGLDAIHSVTVDETVEHGVPS